MLSSDHAWQRDKNRPTPRVAHSLDHEVGLFSMIKWICFRLTQADAQENSRGSIGQKKSKKL
jgi:hypothetical protein